ncbi:MAG: hypothetical protein O2819_04240 [Planctomycetota bacterium]|nr:hypothetical protein [Planctomycetota bacterium]MDA1105927.1 hypothetical protein [Planctomycetota bacterium]
MVAILGSRVATAQQKSAEELALPPLLELSQLAELLEAHAPVPPEKWLDVERAHAEYAAKHAAVFEKDPAIARMSNWRAEEPRADMYGTWVTARETLVRRLLAMEAALFDAVRPLVAEEHQSGMERVRRRRASSWYQGGMRGSGVATGCSADITAVVYAVDATIPYREALAPTLEGYESARARDLDGLFREVMRVAGDMVRAYQVLEQRMRDTAQEKRRQEEQGQVQGEGEGEMDMWMELQVEMKRLSKPLGSMIQSVLARQRRTLSAVEAQIPLEARRPFVDRFITEAYPDVGDSEGLEVPAAIRRALRLRSLTPEEREAVKRIDQSWWAADRAICNDWMDRTDQESERFVGGDGESWAAYSSDLDVLRDRRWDRAHQAQAELAALLGDERNGRMSGPEDAEHFVPDVAAGPGSTTPSALWMTDPEEVDALSAHASAPDALRAFLARRVANDPVGSAVLDVLWGDLVDAWQREVKASLEEGQSLQEKVTVVSDDDVVRFDLAVWQRVQELNQRAIERERELVATLVSELQATATSLDDMSARAAMAWMDIELARTVIQAHLSESRDSGPNAIRVADAVIRSIPPQELSVKIMDRLSTLPAAVATAKELAAEARRHGLAFAQLRAEDPESWWESERYTEIGTMQANHDGEVRELARTVRALMDDALLSLMGGLPEEERAQLANAARRDADGAMLKRLPSLVALIQAVMDALPEDDARRATLEAFLKEAGTEEATLLDAFVAARADAVRFIDARDRAENLEEYQAQWDQYQRSHEAIEVVITKLRQHAQRVLLRLESIVGVESVRAMPMHARCRAVYVEGDLSWAAW